MSYLIFFWFFKFIFFFYFTILYWFCHTSTCIHHGCTRVPHPEPTSHLPPIPSLWVIPVHQPQAYCILHRTWTGNSFLIWYYTCFNAILPNHPPPPSPTKSKRLFYISVSLLLSHIQVVLNFKVIISILKHVNAHIYKNTIYCTYTYLTRQPGLSRTWCSSKRSQLPSFGSVPSPNTAAGIWDLEAML